MNIDGSDRSALKLKIAVPELSGDVHFTALHIARERGIFAGSVPEAELVGFAGGTGDVVRALSDGTVTMGSA